MTKFVHNLCLFKILKNPLSQTTPLIIPTSGLLLPRNHIIKNIIVLIVFVFLSSLPHIEAMRVHPVTTKRNAAFRDNMDLQTEGGAHKKLKKLPHVFSKVLELPFRSDVDVVIEEGLDFFRFIVEIDADGYTVSIGNVRAHAVEIHPGVIKIVVRNDGSQRHRDVELSLDRLEVDKWRYRLPSSSRPEMATALCVDGELIVTVPKSDRGTGFVNGREDWGGGSQVVLVQ